MIPANHRPEEFSMDLRWHPSYNNDPIKVPGFYLSAWFANEGEAYKLCEALSLAPEALRAILEGVEQAVGSSALKSPGLSRLAPELAEHSVKVAKAGLERVRQQRAMLDHTEAVLRQQLAAAGEVDV